MPPARRRAGGDGGVDASATHHVHRLALEDGGGEGGPRHLHALLRRLFLPSGALSPEYGAFQACDSIQALCSYLRGTLTMHATLTGAGLGGGGEGGAPTTAALTIVSTLLLKDVSSMLASLLFSFAFSRGFDDETRFWRLFADVANDVGLTLELAAPLLGAHFLPATLLANAAKALCGVAAGATRAAVSAHFALSGNVAEVQAKEGVQETFVTLAGMAAGYALVSTLTGGGAGGGGRGDGTLPPPSLSHLTVAWGAFLLLTAVHVVVNYVGMRLLALRTVNRSRALGLRRGVTAQLAAGHPPVVMTPLEMRGVDSVVLPPTYAGHVARALRRWLRPCPARGRGGGGVEAGVRGHWAHSAGAWTEPVDFACGVRVEEAVQLVRTGWSVESVGEATRALVSVHGNAVLLIRKAGVGGGSTHSWVALPCLVGRDDPARAAFVTVLSGVRRGGGAQVSPSSTPTTAGKGRRGSVSTTSRGPAPVGGAPLLPAEVEAVTGPDPLAGLRDEGGGLDACVLLWAPRSCTPSLLPAGFTGRLVAPTVRVLRTPRARPSTLYAAYNVACTVLSQDDGWAAVRLAQGGGLCDAVVREAGLSTELLRLAGAAGWSTAEVWLGDGGHTCAL